MLIFWSVDIEKLVVIVMWVLDAVEDFIDVAFNYSNAIFFSSILYEVFLFGY